MRGLFYRIVMRIAHRYHWHYAPPIYPDGDTMLRCKWCGFSEGTKTASRRSIFNEKSIERQHHPASDKAVRRSLTQMNKGFWNG